MVDRMLTIQEHSFESDSDDSHPWGRKFVPASTESPSNSNSSTSTAKSKDSIKTDPKIHPSWPSTKASVYLVQRQDIETNHGRSNILTQILCGRSTSDEANEIAEILARELDDELVPSLRHERALTVADKGDGLYRAVVVTKRSGKGVIEASVVFEVKGQVLNGQ